MADIPHTLFINFVDTPATIEYSQFGEATVPLDPQTGGILNISKFRRVSILVGSTHASSCEVYMGKISGATLATSYSQPLDQKVHTYEVIGPQMSLSLKGGAPHSREQVQLWVYLRS